MSDIEAVIKKDKVLRKGFDEIRETIFSTYGVEVSNQVLVDIHLLIAILYNKHEKLEIAVRLKDE